MRSPIYLYTSKLKILQIKKINGLIMGWYKKLGDKTSACDAVVQWIIATYFKPTLLTHEFSSTQAQTPLVLTL